MSVFQSIHFFNLTRVRHKKLIKQLYFKIKEEYGRLVLNVFS